MTENPCGGGDISGSECAGEAIRIEKALLQSEERFRALTLASSAMTYRMSPDWSAIYQISGFGFLVNTETENSGWLSKYIPPEDRGIVMETVAGAIQNKSVFELEHRVFRADGSVGWVHSTAVPFLDPDGEITEWFGAARDVTARRKAEEALRESEQKARALVQALEQTDSNKNQFISVMSHELRNPLAVIVASLSLLELSDNKEQVSKSTQIIKRQVGQLCKLVDDLLDLSRINQNKIILKKGTVSLGGILRDTALDMEPEYRAKGLGLDVALPEAPVILSADPVRIAQIVGNLLYNALKYTPAGGEVSLSMATENGDAVIRVRDNGAGISSELSRHLFEPFTQADTSPERPNDGGLGLGLAIVKRIAQLHGGSVAAASEGAGKGSLFTVRLPVSTGV